MLKFMEQGNNEGFALVKCDANGTNIVPAVVLSDATEIFIVPRKSGTVSSPCLLIRPQGAATCTVQFSHDHIDHVLSNNADLIWDDSGLGTVSSSTTDDGKRAYFAGTVTAIKIVATGGDVKVRGTV